MSPIKNVIVVGVDGTDTGDAALRFAYAEAKVTGDSIEVLTVWSTEPADVSPYMVHADVSELEAAEQRAKDRQDAAVTRVCGVRSSVPLMRQLIRGDAGTALVAAAKRARVLVVGSRSLSPFRAALLGSVSRYCAHHTECPVVVVPAPATDQAESRNEYLRATEPHAVH